MVIELCRVRLFKIYFSADIAAHSQESLRLLSAVCVASYSAWSLVPHCRNYDPKLKPAFKTTEYGDPPFERYAAVLSFESTQSSGANVTRSPSKAADQGIWHDSREVGCRWLELSSNSF